MSNACRIAIEQNKDSFKGFARGDVLIRVYDKDYSAKVIVGLTSGKRIVLYDIVDFKPTNIDLRSKKEDALQGYAEKQEAHEDSSSSDKIVSQPDTSVNSHSMQKSEKYSVSDEEDSDGNKLSKGQNEFFKDSKVRDDDGNLLIVYHGTNNGEFYTFKNGEKSATDGNAVYVQIAATSHIGFWFNNNSSVAKKNYRKAVIGRAA